MIKYVDKSGKVESKRRRLELLRSQLELERQSHIGHWRDLCDYFLPRRPKFQLTDTNRNKRISKEILDNSGTLALRTLAAGMMGGITSPARPWFRLTTPDPDLAEFGRVKKWLEKVRNRMTTTMLVSPLYNTLPKLYKDLGLIGTAPMMVEESFKTVIRTQSFPMGQWMIGADDEGRVNIFARDFRETVRNLIGKFGNSGQPMESGGRIDWSQFSDRVKDLWEDGHTEEWIDVCHVIQPNEDFNPDAIDARYKKFSSCYYERGISGSSKTNYIDDNSYDRYLRESGYDMFPVLCPRWDISGEDVYASDCPGMTALPDDKQLQHGEKKSLQLLDKKVTPPMKAPADMQQQAIALFPGHINYVPNQNKEDSFKPVYEIGDPHFQQLELKQSQVRQRVSRAFYEDLFLMLAQSDRRQITAREIDERHEEKLLALGPVLEQLNQDLLDPLIDLTYDIMDRQGLIPPPPEEIRGMRLKVEYISIMAQAQKLAGLAGVERFAGFVAGVVNTTKDVSYIDNVNVPKMIEHVADITGVHPDIIRTEEEMAAIQQTREQAQQEAARMETIAAGADAAKKMSETDMTKDSMLKRLGDAARAGQLAPQ